MADLRLSTEVDARVDRYGNALKSRRWTFANLSGDVLDLNAFYMYADITSGNVFHEGAKDSDGQSLKSEPSPLEGDQIRLGCEFNKEVPSGSAYWVELRYRHNQYFRYLPGTRTWFLNEWFARAARLKDVDFVQEEPQRCRFTLIIDDLRWKLFGLLPLQSFSWDTFPPPDSVARNKGTTNLTWERNLGSSEKGQDIVVAYRTSWFLERWAAAILGTLFRFAATGGS